MFWSYRPSSGNKKHDLKYKYAWTEISMWYLTNFYTFFSSQCDIKLYIYIYIHYIMYNTSHIHLLFSKCFVWFLSSKLKLCWILSCLVGFNIHLLGVLFFFFSFCGEQVLLKCFFYICSHSVFTLSPWPGSLCITCICFCPKTGKKHNKPSKWIFKPINYEGIYIILTTLKIIWKNFNIQEKL